jgi:NAD(P)-dependent dehydrogenase (short-subunit alcohol dehydrogenase family)
MGHFLLTTLLLGRMRESVPARVVTVASRAHFDAPGIDFEAVRRSTRSLTGISEYAVSKLANVLFSAELARRLAGSGVTSYALHPGVVASDIWRKLPWPARQLAKLVMISPEQGAQTTLHCATSDSAGSENGLYYDRQRPATPSALAQDRALAEALWTRSERWV